MNWSLKETECQTSDFATFQKTFKIVNYLLFFNPHNLLPPVGSSFIIGPWAGGDKREEDSEKTHQTGRRDTAEKVRNKWTKNSQFSYLLHHNERKMILLVNLLEYSYIIPAWSEKTSENYIF